MKNRNPVSPAPTNFDREDTYQTVDGFIISKGDLLKIKGEYGSRFTFHSLTTNRLTGSQWVDCFEVSKGQVGALRSFSLERIKRIPKKRIKK